MKKIKAIVLSEYIEDVMHAFGRLGIVQIVDIRDIINEWGHLAPTFETENIDRCSDLLKRINRVTKVLGIPPDAKIEKTIVEERPFAEQLEYVDNRLKKIEEVSLKTFEDLEGLNEEEEEKTSAALTLESLKGIDASISWLGESKFLYTVAGVLNFLDLEVLDGSLEGIAGEDHLILNGMRKGKKISVIVIAPIEHKREVEHALDVSKFNRLSTVEGNVADILKETQIRLEEIKSKKEFLKKELSGLMEKNVSELVTLREIVQIEKNLAEGISLLGKTQKVHGLEGWVPDKVVEQLKEEIKRISEGCILVKTFDPAEDDEVPTAFDNPGLVRPFETLTESFGLPAYNEIDPTLFLAISFPFIFGMMFGDVGEGAIIALVGYVIYSRFGKQGKTYDNFGKILFACGFTSIIFGFLYGTIFGLEEVLPVLWMSPIHKVKEGMMSELFSIALSVGVIHMGLGLTIDAVNRSYKRGPLSAIGSIGKLLLFFGVVMIITKLFGFPIPIFSVGMEYSMITITLFGIFVPILLIAAEEVIYELKQHATAKHIISNVSNVLFEVADSIIMFLGNTISYSRIVILALIHAIISEVIFVISELVKEIPLVGLPLYYASVIILTAVLVLGLEGIIVYVHTLRLHYYEWFTKFYKADGIKFEPFKVNREYTLLKGTR